MELHWIWIKAVDLVFLGECKTRLVCASARLGLLRFYKFVLLAICGVTDDVH